MDGRLHERVIRRRVVMLAAVAVLAAPSAATTAVPSLHCSKGQVALRGTKHGNQLKLARKGPVVACVTQRKEGSDPIAHFRAMKALVRNDSLATPGYRRFTRKHSRGKPVSFAPLDREVEGFLAAQGTGANPPARDIRTYPFTKVDHGIAMSGHGWDVSGDYPDEVLYSGGRGIDETGIYDAGPQNRTHIRVHLIHYEGSFSKACPAAGGTVAADYEYHDLVQTAQEFAGKRIVTSGETRVIAKAVGHVNGEARLTDYNVHFEITNVRKAHVEIAGTGKVLEQAPATNYRASIDYSGGTLDGSNHGTLSGGTITGTPGTAVLTTLFAGIAIPDAKSMLEDRLTEAQQWWYGDDNARDPAAHLPGNCVELSFDPNPVKLAPGDTKSVNVTLKAKADGAETAAKHHATALVGTVSPDQATSSPGTSAAFDYTSPNPRTQSGSFAAFTDEAVSNRGRARTADLAENLVTTYAYKILSTTLATHATGVPAPEPCAAGGLTTSESRSLSSTIGTQPSPLVSKLEPTTVNGARYVSGVIDAKVQVSYTDKVDSCQFVPADPPIVPCSFTSPVQTHQSDIQFVVDYQPWTGSTVELHGWWDGLDAEIGVASGSYTTSCLFPYIDFPVPTADTTTNIPLSKFTATGPQTISFSGTKHFTRAEYVGTTTVDYDWTMSITYERVDENGNPL